MDSMADPDKEAASNRGKGRKHLELEAPKRVVLGILRRLASCRLSKSHSAHAGKGKPMQA
jgi:hypothetical protein